MAELPKFVRHRLRRTSIAASPSGSAPVPTGISKPVEHPDANLLAAFIEQSLSKPERESVMTHLAECVECREQVSLALPPKGTETPSVLAVAPRVAKPAWLRWQVVRWAGLAASWGVVCIVVLHHPGRSNLQKFPAPAGERAAAPSLQTRTTASSGVPTEPTSRAAPVTATGERRVGLPVPRKAEMASANEQPVLPRSSHQPRADLKDIERPANLPASTELLREETKKATEPAAAATTPPVLALRSRPEAANHIAAEAAGPSALEASKAMPAPAPAEKQSSVVTSAPASPKPSPAPSPEAVARADKLDEVSPTAKGKATGGSTAMNSRDVKAPGGVGGQLLSSQARKETTGARRATEPSSAPDLRYESAESAVRWTISSDGKVERSMDGGKTWERVEIDKSVSFRAVAANLQEVWAGGSGGALYHSIDNGAHWARVRLTARGATLDDIAGIDFKDSRQCTVTTAAGETWITADGGEHWRRRR